MLGGVLGELLRRLPGRVPFLCSSEQGQSPPGSLRTRLLKQLRGPARPEVPRAMLLADSHPQQFWGNPRSGACRWWGELHRAICFGCRANRCRKSSIKTRNQRRISSICLCIHIWRIMINCWRISSLEDLILEHFSPVK